MPGLKVQTNLAMYSIYSILHYIRYIEYSQYIQYSQLLMETPCNARYQGPNQLGNIQIYVFKTLICNLAKIEHLRHGKISPRNDQVGQIEVLNPTKVFKSPASQRSKKEPFALPQQYCLGVKCF